MKAREFVDNEAELSESEWGSADEDEKNLDKLDMELGDEDEFDQNQLHSELERIHMRRVLDQDAREVKILQEMLLEDEENDGVGRERKFRWRNVDNSLSLENDIRKEDEKALNNDSDDENELLWRKMRFERELILKERENHKVYSTLSTSIVYLLFMYYISRKGKHLLIVSHSFALLIQLTVFLGIVYYLVVLARKNLILSNPQIAIKIMQRKILLF